MPAFATVLAGHRRLVLAAAALLGLVAAGGLSPSPAATPRDAPPSFHVAELVTALIPEALASPTVEIRIAANDKAKEPAAAEAEEAADTAAEAAASTPPNKARKGRASVGITVDDDSGRVRVTGGDGSREFDSFEAFVQQAPWIAGLVFASTFLVFLTPVLIVALVIWYKVRKNRMMNETMVRLAEKGFVPPNEAFDAVAGGRTSAMRDSPSTAPLYQQAKSVRQREAWSDFRKGLIVGAVGLGFVFYSMLDDGSPNFVGLVLLFVGLAYIVLWYFEERQVPASRDLPPPPAPPVA
ncbi:MAG: DUF6249 domain-containing protein [Betaproteobacteria bacterium]